MFFCFFMFAFNFVICAVVCAIKHSVPEIPRQVYIFFFFFSFFIQFFFQKIDINSIYETKSIEPLCCNEAFCVWQCTHPNAMLQNWTSIY